MAIVTTLDEVKVIHGTAAWFHMVGTLMMDAAARAQLPPDFNISLVEHYTDGAELDEGLVQGLRFEIIRGRPSFRHGSQAGERADVTIEVTMAASRALNTLYAADRRFARTLASLQERGEFKVSGELAQLGDWFTAVHDRIVDRTR